MEASPVRLKGYPVAVPISIIIIELQLKHGVKLGLCLFSFDV